jgi:hypothetical protein
MPRACKGKAKPAKVQELSDDEYIPRNTKLKRRKVVQEPEFDSDSAGVFDSANSDESDDE